MIFVYGCGNTKEDVDIDHDRILVQLLEKCAKHDQRLSAKNLLFKCPSVTFMGQKVTHKGAEPDPVKVAAIREMLVPTDKASAHRFLGVCHCLFKFFHNLSETVLPLRNLAKDDSASLWSESHETVLPQQLRSTIMTHTSRHLTIYAIGGVLLQDRRPVCFTSYILTNTERNDAQIEE